MTTSVTSFHLKWPRLDRKEKRKLKDVLKHPGEAGKTLTVMDREAGWDHDGMSDPGTTHRKKQIGCFNSVRD